MIKIIFLAAKRLPKPDLRKQAKQLHEFSRIVLRIICCKKKTQIKNHFNLWQKKYQHPFNSWKFVKFVAKKKKKQIKKSF
jgi:hypothetical protein